MPEGFQHKVRSERTLFTHNKIKHNKAAMLRRTVCGCFFAYPTGKAHKLYQKREVCL